MERKSEMQSGIFRRTPLRSAADFPDSQFGDRPGLGFGFGSAASISPFPRKSINAPARQFVVVLLSNCIQVERPRAGLSGEEDRARTSAPQVLQSFLFPFSGSQTAKFTLNAMAKQAW